MTELIWEEPPAQPRGSKGGKLQRVANELRTRPGTWAFIPFSSTSARNFSKVHSEFEVTVRNAGKSDEKTYMRYVGSESD